jgi:dTDP-4-dehydrorhamnose reductase
MALIIMTNQKKRVLVTGKNGQLGQSIKQLTADYSQLTMTFVGRDQLDLASTESIEAYFSSHKYDAIINCAAYTAVDKAESEPDLANQINHLAVKQLAEIAKQQDATLIHISTDYVFNGQNYKPYIESDETEPQSVYGLTKLNGEQAMQAIDPKGCIIRTSWVYSEYGNNFVKTMLRLGKEKEQLGIIFDQIGTPTYAGDLAKACLDVIASEEKQTTTTPIYHYSNEGVCSWYDFAKAIFELNDIDCNVNPIETKDYPTSAARPHYSLMNKTKIKQAFDLTIPYWKDSLQICIKRLQELN